MATVEELVVKATPEGMGEVNDELEGMEKKVQETTDEVEDTGSSLSEMASKFKGAMGAILGGIALGVGGVLSQVPALGGVVAGLGAIFNALALQLDGKLRPTLNKITTAFFDIARAISQGNYQQALGRFKQLVKEITGLEDLSAKSIIGKVQGIFGELAGKITKALTKFFNSVSKKDFEQFYAKVINLLKFAFTNAFKMLKNEINWTKLVGSLIRFLGRAVLALKKPIQEEIVGPLVTYIENHWREWLDDAIVLAKNLIATLISGIKQRMPVWKEKVKQYITKKAEDVIQGLIDSGKQMGKDFVNEIIDGIEDKTSALVDKVQEMVSEMRSYLPGSPAETGPLSDLDKTGPGLVNTFSSGIDKNLGTVKKSSENLAESAKPAANAIGRQSGRTIIEIEGRQVERATRDFRSDGTDLRGRYG